MHWGRGGVRFPRKKALRRSTVQCYLTYEGVGGCLIFLLTIAGKLFARVLLNRLIVPLELGLLPESQCGFRGGRGTVDTIFAARQLQ